jgi:MraZ protein
LDSRTSEGRPNVFYGEHRHTLDEKNRLSIPAKFRALLQGPDDDAFYLTRGIDRCILICTKAVWQEMERQFCDHPITNPVARRFKRMFYSAGLKRDVVLVGVSDGVEVWDSGAWDTQLAESLDNIEETARKLSKEPTE